jgi:hypothetical protein
VFEHLTVVSSSAGNQQVALPGRQLCSSRAPTTSSRGSVAPTTAGSSSYSGVRSNGGNSSSLSRYCQQLSWSSGRSTAVAPGVCKTDRVARFQKMQQAWQKDRWAAVLLQMQGTLRVQDVLSRHGLASACVLVSSSSEVYCDSWVLYCCIRLCLHTEVLWAVGLPLDSMMLSLKSVQCACCAS